MGDESWTDNTADLAYAAWCAKRAQHGGGVTTPEDFGAWLAEHCDEGVLPSDACRLAWDAASPDHTGDDEHFEAWADAHLGSIPDDGPG